MEQRFRLAPDSPFPTFLADADKTQVHQEQEKLADVGFALNYLTSEVLAYAKQHPDDSRVPQALYLAVRATRYGCTSPDTTYLSQAAFKLLHERYPKSEWAEKTKYHY
jgi:outer membrane protein assembly factor BamD (BamD/ComL family)